MALNTGINSLDAGAPKLRLKGKRTAELDAKQLWEKMMLEDYKPTPDEIQLIQQYLQMMSQAKGQKGVMAAQGGRMGLRFGGHPHSSDSPGGSGQTNGNQGNQGTWQPSSPPYQPSVVNVAASEDAYTTPEIVQDKTTGEVKVVDAAASEDAYLPPKTVEEVLASEDAYLPPKTVEEVLASEDAYLPPKTVEEVLASEDIIDFEYDYPKYEDTTPTITTGGEGEGPIVTDTTSTVPLTTEDTGLTADEDAAAVADLDYGKTFPTEFQDVPFPEYGKGAFTPTVTAPQISFEAPGAARGGRAGYDRGGIAGARQGYFLGDIVKSITKPIKKIAKSPLGKAALMYAATAGLGNLAAGAQGAAWGTPWGTAGARGWLHPSMVGSNLTSLFSRSPASLEKIAKAKKMSVSDLSFFDKISPWKATAAITSLASVPLWARPENWDEMDSAEQEAWLKEYHSKVAAFKEDYGGEMDVKLTPASGLPHQFAAQGGRVGLKGGRSVREAALRQLYNINDDEEENTGIKQLFSDTWRAAKGGRAKFQVGGIGGIDPDYNIDAMRDPFAPAVDKGVTTYDDGSSTIPGFTRLKNPDGAPGTYNEFMYRGPDGQTYGAQTYGAISAGRYPDIYDPNKASTNVPGTPIVPTSTGAARNMGGTREAYDPASGTFTSLGGTNYDKASTPVAGDKSLLEKWGEHAQTSQAMKGETGLGTIPEYGMQTGYDYQTRFKTDPRISSYLASLWQLPQEMGRAGIKYLKNPAEAWKSNALSEGWKTANVQAGQNIEGIMAAAPGGSGLTTGQQADRNKYLSSLGQRVENLQAGGVDPRMAGTYAQNKQLLGDPRMRGPAAMAARGGRIAAQEGGLMNLGGMEKDYRQEGGFVPIGGQEKADDVPARLSKNEFVFTADAVRAAGGGDVDKGAEIMENVMENLEAGGKVSEESQGLEGARNMFATSQQLEKRII
jgi:hypothetical protein